MEFRIEKYKKAFLIDGKEWLEKKMGGKIMSKGETVYGITYRDPQEAKKAKKEWEGIQYILAENNMENIETVLTVYNKLAERNILKTEVGAKFLRELKERLLEAKEIENQRIYGLQPEDEQWLRVRERDKAKKEELLMQKNKKNADSYYRQKYYHSLILNFLLIAAILIMAYITLNSNHVNILNYENTLLNKYASWEADLQQREAELNAKERELTGKSSQN